MHIFNLNIKYILIFTINYQSNIKDLLNNSGALNTRIKNTTESYEDLLGKYEKLLAKYKVKVQVALTKILENSYLIKRKKLHIHIYFKGFRARSKRI